MSVWSLILYNRFSCREYRRELQHCKIKATIIDWTVKKRNSLLLLDSNSYHRLTWRDWERLRHGQIARSSAVTYLLAAVAWTAEGGSCSNRWNCCYGKGCSNRWDCCYEQRVAAAAGIAVTSTTVAASTGVAVANTKVSAIGGLAVTNTKVAAIAGIAVLKRCGRGWILPFMLPLITALVTMTKFYCEAVQDVCWCLHWFCARLVL